MKRPAEEAEEGAAKAAKAEAPPDDPLEVRAQLFKLGGLKPEGDCGQGKWTLVAPGVGELASKEPVELIYFAIRGLGQLPQLILEVAGYPYRYTVVVAPYFGDHLKAKLAFGRLPCLKTASGLEIVQSKAVARFAAKIGGLAGASEEETARCDMLHEMLLTEAALEAADLKALETGDVDTAGDVKALSRVAAMELSSRDKALAALKFWEGLLAASKSGWVLGGLGDGRSDALCYVDLAVYWKLRLFAAVLERCSCPALRQHLAKVAALPGMARLLESGRMMPEITQPGYKFTEDELVKKP